MVDVAIETLVDVEEISRVLDQLNEEEVTSLARNELPLPRICLVPVSRSSHYLPPRINLQRRKDSALAELMTHRGDVEVKLTGFQRLTPKFSQLTADAAELATTVGKSSSLAEHVSSKVRELDLVKSRLQETLKRVRSYPRRTLLLEAQDAILWL